MYGIRDALPTFLPAGAGPGVVCAGAIVTCDSLDAVRVVASLRLAPLDRLVGVLLPLARGSELAPDTCPELAGREPELPTGDVPTGDVPPGAEEDADTDARGDGVVKLSPTGEVAVGTLVVIEALTIGGREVVDVVVDRELVERLLFGDGVVRPGTAVVSALAIDVLLDESEDDEVVLVLFDSEEDVALRSFDSEAVALVLLDAVELEEREEEEGEVAFVRFVGRRGGMVVVVFLAGEAEGSHRGRGVPHTMAFSAAPYSISPGLYLTPVIGLKRSLSEPCTHLIAAIAAAAAPAALPALLPAYLPAALHDIMSVPLGR